MLHSWLPHAALLAATGSACISIYTFTSPLAAARQYGIDLGSVAAGGPASGATLAYVPMFGGRNLALALTMMVFYAQRQPRALGTVLLCCAVSAIVDTVVTGRWGVHGMAWQHVVGAVVLAGLGCGLVV